MAARFKRVSRTKRLSNTALVDGQAMMLKHEQARWTEKDGQTD
jgi:hypothetical protein